MDFKHKTQLTKQRIYVISKETIFRTSNGETFTSESSAIKHEESLEDGTCIYILYKIDRDTDSIVDIVAADESYSKIYKYGLELEEAMKKNESFYSERLKIKRIVKLNV